MINLLVNTTTPYPTIYSDHQGEYSSYKSDDYNSHSQNLIPLIEKFLKYYNVGMEVIDNIFIITGPGSYTGIRVGISLVLGLKISLNINIIPITLFDAYFVQYKNMSFGQVLILVDSKKNGEYYYRNIVPCNNVDNIGVASLESISGLVQDNGVICGEFNQERVEEYFGCKGVKSLNSNFVSEVVFRECSYLQGLGIALEAFYLKKTIFTVK